ncbi:hypothetical protein [Nocardia niwae]|uniref:hypothetical protein n=1 Tax=Nocardia niwae TaxID=626084 RepID=UPI0007A47B7C|nr:hypothetical protein [Nocardia niwae]
MSAYYDHGPLDTYEIVWTWGHVERIQAHQVLLPPDDSFPFKLGEGVCGSTETVTKPRRGWAFHGEIDGRWRLLLSARAEDIRSVRNVTHTTDDLGGAS